jgi:hypothetical protein
MSLRILHTADNHIGLSFNQYSEVAQKRLTKAPSVPSPSPQDWPSPNSTSKTWTASSS